MASATEFRANLRRQPSFRPRTPATTDGTRPGSDSENQINRPTIPVKGREQAAGNLQRQRGFPDPPGSGQRDRSVGGYEIPAGPAQQRFGRSAQTGRGHIGKKRLDRQQLRIGSNRVCRRVPFPNRPVPHETITPTGGRLYRSSIGPERLADRGYVNLDLIFLDDRARPYTSHELVLGDELTGRLNQNRKDLERAVPQGNRDSTRPQFTPSEIHLPPFELVYQTSALFRHVR